MFSCEPDRLPIDRSNFVEFDFKVSGLALVPAALDCSDSAMADGAGRDNGEFGDFYIADNDDLYDVSDPGFLG